MKFLDIGIGTDIEDIEKFCERINNKKFLCNIFTPKELEYCFSKKNANQHLAARFSGKEAVIKALSKFQITDLKLSQIEILNDVLGVPQVSFLRDDLENFCVEISLSHNEKNSLAFALVYFENNGNKHL